jgi:hypothetical protein
MVGAGLTYNCLILGELGLQIHDDKAGVTAAEFYVLGEMAYGDTLSIGKGSSEGVDADVVDTYDGGRSFINERYSVLMLIAVEDMAIGRIEGDSLIGDVEGDTVEGGTERVLMDETGGLLDGREEDGGLKREAEVRITSDLNLRVVIGTGGGYLELTLRIDYGGEPVTWIYGYLDRTGGEFLEIGHEVKDVEAEGLELLSGEYGDGERQGEAERGAAAGDG